MPLRAATHQPRLAAAPRHVCPEQQRGHAGERGYGGRWRKARLTFLARHTLCRACEGEGRLTPATVVDHIVPHKGDQTLFWDTGNWQPLCKHHHDAKTAREDGGFGRASRREG